MNRIKILPDILANQIAAGEVVERPASVIKELVENSIDAGAKRLKIEIELGGRRLIRVADEGMGMLRDDAILAFERHATSKISELKDLGSIATLGFRGEALASIASVARVELVTKVFDSEAATKVLIEGGKLAYVKEAARPTGTTVTVRDLFFNTPARRKFMRSQATENYHITSIIQHYALAHPEIAFSLTNNGRETIRVAPAKNLRERAFQMFGGEIVESLLPVDGGREFIARISGYVSAPRERRTTHDFQYFFINQRFVRDKIIRGGLLEGYRSVLPHGVYPVAFLFLDVPHEEIDVNVHPAKTEVRFRRAQAVKDVIAEAVRAALKTAGIVRNIDSKFSETAAHSEGSAAVPKDQSEFAAEIKSENDSGFSGVRNFSSGAFKPKNSADEAQLAEKSAEAESAAQGKIDFEIPASSDDFESMAFDRSGEFEREKRAETGNFTAPLRENFNAEEFGQKTDLSAEGQESETPADQNFVSVHGSETARNSFFEQTHARDALPPVDSAQKIPKPVEVEKVSAGRIQPLGQMHDSFIIAVDDEGLLLIDQHVAHERILFDKFRHRESERKIESQNLLLPETIDLTPAQAAAFEEIETELEDCGFGLMKLSGRTIAIKSVPTDLPAAEVRNLFAEILETVEKDKRGAAKASIRDNIAATMACKAAVKINMKLTPEKMRWMIDRLLLTSSPTTCPHGRPVILRLTMKDIERKFHRS